MRNNAGSEQLSNILIPYQVLNEQRLPESPLF